MVELGNPNGDRAMMTPKKAAQSPLAWLDHTVQFCAVCEHDAGDSTRCGCGEYTIAKCQGCGESVCTEAEAERHAGTCWGF